jgi:hypothetical protein
VIALNRALEERPQNSGPPGNCDTILIFPFDAEFSRKSQLSLSRQATYRVNPFISLYIPASYEFLSLSRLSSFGRRSSSAEYVASNARYLRTSLILLDIPACHAILLDVATVTATLPGVTATLG